MLRFAGLSLQDFRLPNLQQSTAATGVLSGCQQHRTVEFMGLDPGCSLRRFLISSRPDGLVEAAAALAFTAHLCLETRFVGAAPEQCGVWKKTITQLLGPICTGSKRISYKSQLGSMPLGRFQSVEDVADAVVFLASRATAQITREALNISGGLVME